MRWNGQEIDVEQPGALPGLGRLDTVLRQVRPAEFPGVTFHEVLAKTALNHVPATSRAMANSWTINPYRGCQHACVYCFARPTHRYLDLDEGRDFETEIVVKINIAEVLAHELLRKGDQVPRVDLGTNTDPYQRSEGRYQLMPKIIHTLVSHGRPLSILTKGTLLRRDLGLLSEAAAIVPVGLAMSIAVYDQQLQQAIEPGTPSTGARLATVRAIQERGLECSVLLMPILPYLTDSPRHLDRALAMIKETGAQQVAYAALHLRPGVKEWFMSWLDQTHPELVGRYQELYRAGAYAPASYRRWLGDRVDGLIRRHGLNRGPRSRREREGAGAHLRGIVPPAPSLDPQPSLFG